jgi:hypothetical protein
MQDGSSTYGDQPLKKQATRRTEQFYDDDQNFIDMPGDFGLGAGDSKPRGEGLADFLATKRKVEYHSKAVRRFK